MTACPQCGSDDTATLRAIWEGGTATTSGGLIGAIGGQVGYGVTVGQTMTRAAERAAPPERRHWRGSRLACICAVLACIVLTLASLNESQKFERQRTGFEPIIGFVVAGVCGLVAVATFNGWRSGQRYNARVWPGKHDHWSRTWVCRRCGKRFVPTTVDRWTEITD